MTLLVAVVAGNQGRVFAAGMSLVCSARRIDTGGGSRILASLLSVSTMLLLLLLLSSFLVGGVAVFRPRGMWGLV